MLQGLAETAASSHSQATADMSTTQTVQAGKGGQPFNLTIFGQNRKGFGRATSTNGKGNGKTRSASRGKNRDRVKGAKGKGLSKGQANRGIQGVSPPRLPVGQGPTGYVLSPPHPCKATA